MSVLDLSAEPGGLTLESFLLSIELEKGRTGEAPKEALLNAEQMHDFYSALQNQVRFDPGTVIPTGEPKWAGITVRMKEDA